MQRWIANISKPWFAYFFYGLWLLLALWQANFTELISDEAYYWQYSRYLDWGYFDHPPMVALLIKLGYATTGGELGVRLLFVMLGTSTLWLIEKITNPSNKPLFYTIISSIGLLYFTSFIALPDVPLLFFTACFFYLFKQYHQTHSWRLALSIGFVTAALLLSKYHGFIVIFIAILSNLSLFKKPSFYIAVLSALLLVLPHYFWQVNNNFPSVQYHFYDRNLNAYSILNTVNYLLTQLVLFGPFIGLFLWIGFAKFKPKTVFEKTLHWQVIGIIIFFLLLTFNGKVQGHWTSVLVIPLIYFGYHYYNQPHKLTKWVYYQWPVSILLILLVKIALVYELPLGPKISPVFNDFRGKRAWAEAIKTTTKNTPVVFMNSYQNASIYQFYAKEKAITLSNVMSRKNQYDLWQFEDSLRGETVFILPNYVVSEFDTIANLNPLTPYRLVNNFHSYAQVQLRPVNWSDTASINSTISVCLVMEKADKFTFLENTNYPSFISYSIFKNNVLLTQQKTEMNGAAVNRNQINIEIPAPAEKGVYQVYFSIQTGWLPPGLNSRVYLVNIQ